MRVEESGTLKRHRWRTRIDPERLARRVLRLGGVGAGMAFRVGLRGGLPADENDPPEAAVGRTSACRKTPGSRSDGKPARAGRRTTWRAAAVRSRGDRGIRCGCPGEAAQGNHAVSAYPTRGSPPRTRSAADEAGRRELKTSDVPRHLRPPCGAGRVVTARRAARNQSGRAQTLRACTTAFREVRGKWRGETHATAHDGRPVPDCCRRLGRNPR